MVKDRSSLCVVGVLVILSITTARASDLQTLTIMSALGKHADVTSSIERRAWNESSDPSVALVYCGSQFALASADAGCQFGGKPQSQVKRFGEALWQMWRGNSKSARRIFEELDKDTPWREWGRIGLLELALYTGNIRALESLLRRYEPSAAGGVGSKIFSDALIRYRLQIELAQNNWERIISIVEKYPTQRVVSDLNLFSPYSTALFITGQKTKLERLLKRASSALHQTADYLLRVSELTILSSGVESSDKLIQDSAASYPSSVDLTIRSAYLDLVDESPSVSRKAVETLYGIAGAPGTHIGIVLEIATILARYHKADESLTVYRLIDYPEFTSLEDFAMHHTLLAWYAAFRGDVAEVKRELDATLNMAPNHVDANWLRALLAKKENNVQMGTRAARALFENDPYNGNFAALVLHFRAVQKTPELDELYRAVSRHKKYYSASIQRRILEQ